MPSGWQSGAPGFPRRPQGVGRLIQQLSWIERDRVDHFVRARSSANRALRRRASLIRIWAMARATDSREGPSASVDPRGGGLSPI